MKMVFDLDGTICFSGKPLSSKMVHALDFLVNEGHEIIFASARPIRDLLPVIPTHMHSYSMVGGNGAFVAALGNILSTVHFDTGLTDKLIRLIQEYEASYLIDSRWDYAYTGDEDHPIRRNVDPDRRAVQRPLEELNEIVKIVILHSNDQQSLLSELQQLSIVIHMHGSENIIDISPTGVDKWAGLQALGLRPQEFIAFGNDANDMSMFKHAQRSICVGNHPELTDLATEQVLNEEERVVEKIINLCREHVAVEYM
ncbi:Cof-type HAD-IIB family hydrolase [Paenibacillus sp. SC116]|uniref:Cof-type HAD-IIB family hydrolase n=1 Tax=Paenibacillus sp. SC116 TaxID=2968986 RepID=UPI00215A10DF|nr:Cof-type HAD-IIB family hydrolase [Paenibacillus sp. SC116]MCR8842399.1 Cof-type HAD-IIB family hydrolase [Paenibacillus sp. SC116]